MQSTRRFNKRQPLSVTSLPVTVETAASLGSKGPVHLQTSAPLYHHPAGHVEQPHDQHTNNEVFIQNSNSNHYGANTDIHNHTQVHEQYHPGHYHTDHTQVDNQPQPSPQPAHDHSHNHNHHNHSHQEHQHNHNHNHNDHFDQRDYLQHKHSHDHDHPQQHGHDHSHHDHSHDHSHPQQHAHSHGHDHHKGHDHGHDDHHHHDHHHSYPPVFTPPLPSWSELFATLSPSQKTLFTWFLIHSAIGIWVYCIGTANGNLAVVGFSYLVIFDALGVLNSFVSTVIRTSTVYGTSFTKRPFGAHRYEIVFAMATTVYLLFATMHNTKESLEHFLLEGHHGGEHHEEKSAFGFGMFLAVVVAIGTCCLASVALRNHDNFVRFLRRTPPTVHGFSYNVINRARGSPIHIVLSNVYSSSIVACGCAVLFFNMFGLSSFDKLLALSESVVMFYLAYPTAKALANLLLQTTPNTVRQGVETRLHEIRQDPNVISVDRVHFWQNTYGRCVGTLEVQIRPEADEQAVLQFVYQKLEGLTSDTDKYDDGSQPQPSELTVSIIKP